VIDAFRVWIGDLINQKSWFLLTFSGFSLSKLKQKTIISKQKNIEEHVKIIVAVWKNAKFSQKFYVDRWPQFINPDGQ
jgi:hypothetical protein